MKSKKSKKSKNILIICPFPFNTAAGQRLKYEQYFDYWKADGYNVQISSFINYADWCFLYKKGHFLKKFKSILLGYFKRIRDLFILNKYDLVYIFMWVTPLGTALFEKLYLHYSKKVIFDLEDNLLVNNNLSKKNNPNKIISFLKSPDKQYTLIKESDYVITSSPELEKICRQINKKNSAKFITSSVDVKKFVPKNFSNKKVVIGWTGTFSSKEYLESIEDILQELAIENQFELHIIGNFEYQLENVDLTVKQWSLEAEVEQMQALDIGLYPLPLNDWVQGKSGLKAIQYMAFGIPTIATKVGNTPNIITNRREGFLVNKREEWISALKELILDNNLRKEMGNKARKKAINKYSLETVSKSYAKILNLCTEE